jgi:phosphatidylinositol glycan class B
MKNLSRSPYSKLYFTALVVFVITSFFSKGYHHADEHFQILEFTNYKLGHCQASDLPWEFREKIRPALQPFIAFIIIKSLTFLGIHDPFTWAFILRLLTAITAWFIICKFDEYLIVYFTTDLGKRLFVVMSLFLWFVPYIFVRFSSETMAGVCFLYGLYLLLKFSNNRGMKDLPGLLLAGLFLGFSFFFRFQIGIAILGLGCWLFFVKRISWQSTLMLAGSALFAVFISLVIDFWFYSEWVFTPARYFDINIIHHKAAEWGVQPWWYYFSLFTLKVMPPISIVLLLLFLAGLFRNRTGVFVFILIPFLLVHLFLGHKEIRFLFPMVYPFLYVVAQGNDLLVNRIKPNLFYRYGYLILLGMNGILLIYILLTPAETTVQAYKYFYRYVRDNQAEIWSIKKPFYELAGLKMNFYRPPGVTERVFNSLPEMDQYLRTNRPASALLYVRYPVLDYRFRDFTTKRCCSMLPGWLLKFNINHWQDRATIWSIYEIKRQ